MSCARLVFAPVGEHRAFAPWVRSLAGHCGVYVIRDLSGQVLYVGESHRQKLYETMTRHFQTWEGRTAGPTYYRGRVEVAACIVSAEQAVDVQNALITALRPADNRQVPGGVLVEDDDLTDVPF